MVKRVLRSTSVPRRPVEAEDQISFPKAGYGAIGSFRRA
jgi:hypothetical protein